MNIHTDDIKWLIGDLLGITDKEETEIDELEIITLLRKPPIRFEYADLLAAENDEVSKMKGGDSDVKKFTFRHLQQDYTKKLNIRSGHTELKELQVFIFNDKLLKYFETNDDKDILRNNKIKEWKTVYSFFIGLLKDEVCKLNIYKNALRVLGADDLKQADFDNDVYFNEHDNAAREILEKYLLPFMSEYRSYLGT